MRLSRIGFLSAVALLAPFAVFGANTIYHSVDFEDGTLVVGASYAASTTPTPTMSPDLIALKKGQTAAARKELDRKSYGGLVIFDKVEPDDNGALADALRQRFSNKQSGKSRYASLPPNGEG